MVNAIDKNPMRATSLNSRQRSRTHVLARVVGEDAGLHEVHRQDVFFFELQEGEIEGADVVRERVLVLRVLLVGRSVGQSVGWVGGLLV